MIPNQPATYEAGREAHPFAMAPSAAKCFPKAPRDRSSRGGGHGGTEEKSCVESLGMAMVGVKGKREWLKILDTPKLEGCTNPELQKYVSVSLSWLFVYPFFDP